MSFFSVIVPNYNHASFLKQRIDSILKQSCQDFELIILDDGSSDGSKNIIGQYKNHPKVAGIYYNAINSGSPFKQWQKGVGLAKNEWIWVAESDDYADADFLQTAYDCITKHNIQLFYCNAYFVDAQDAVFNTASIVKNNFFGTEKWSRDYLTDGETDLNAYLKFLCIINNASAMVVRKDLAQSIIEKSTAYTYYGDWVFYINAFLTACVGYCHQPLCYYRTHAASHVNPAASILKTKQEYFRILRHLLSLEQVSDKEKVVAFFALHYLGFGIAQEGLLNGLQAFRQYLSMDKKIGWQVIKKVLYYRLTFQRNTKQYP